MLHRIEQKVTRHNFYKWFKNSALVAERDDVLVVSVKDDIFAKWIERHHASELAEALAETRAGARVEFVTDNPYNRKPGAATR